MTNILIGEDAEIKIHYYYSLKCEPGSMRSKLIRNTVRDMLSLLASRQDSLPSDLNEVVFYSTDFGRHVSINASELIEDFILHKRTKRRYSRVVYRPYQRPDDSEFISYFLRALQSVKTRLEVRKETDENTVDEMPNWKIGHGPRKAQYVKTCNG